MSTTTEYVVRRSVTVEAHREHAFRVFTEELKAWWPLDSHHIGAVEAADAVIEPREGGRVYELGVDGSTCDWGRVTRWDPPARFAFAWMLNADWEYDPDLGRSTEVEVTFTAEGPATTLVELVHSGFERLGDRGDEVRTSVGGEGGWGSLLQRYAETASRA